MDTTGGVCIAFTAHTLVCEPRVSVPYGIPSPRDSCRTLGVSSFGLGCS